MRYRYQVHEIGVPFSPVWPRSNKRTSNSFTTDSMSSTRPLMEKAQDIAKREKRF